MNSSLAEGAKICTSIPATNIKNLQTYIQKALSLGSEYIEIRFDYMDYKQIFKLQPLLKNYVDQCIFTCRKADEGGLFADSEDIRIKTLEELSKQHPAYLDIELSTVEKKPEITDNLRSSGSSIIVSWHNFSETPSLDKLQSIYSRAQNLGDISKIITFAKTFKDNATVLSLVKSAKKDKLVSFCMGELGLLSRTLSVFMGSPFTYASLGKNKTASGQITIKELKEFYAAF